MNTDELLSRMHALGVVLTVDRNELIVDAPAGMLGEEDWSALSENKPRIVSLLTERCPRCSCVLELTFRETYVGAYCKADPLHFSTIVEGARGTCTDCGEKTQQREGRCFHCLEILLFLPSEPCLLCSGVQFWRHRDGFAWHCSKCEPAPAGTIVLELQGYAAEQGAQRAAQAIRITTELTGYSRTPVVSINSEQRPAH